eukprot:6744302-Prymnesium_polylepis.1
MNQIGRRGLQVLCTVLAPAEGEAGRTKASHPKLQVFNVRSQSKSKAQLADDRARQEAEAEAARLAAADAADAAL